MWKYNYLPKINGGAIPKLTTEMTKLMTSIAVCCSLGSWQQAISTEVLNKTGVLYL